MKTTKSWFFEETNKIHKPLATLTKKKGKRSSKITKEKEVTTDSRRI